MINVATGVDISVTEIADLVLDALGKPASLKVHVDERPGPGRPPHRLDREGGAAPRLEARTSFEEGLARTVALVSRQ